MNESASLPAHHEQPRWRWWLFLAAIAVTLVLGVRGFREYERAAAPAAGELGRLSALYDTLQLFALHTPHLDERLVNPSLDIARWVAAAISLWTVFAALRRVFAMEVRRFRLSFSRNHVVICGAGWRGSIASCSVRKESWRTVRSLSSSDSGVVSRSAGCRLTACALGGLAGGTAGNSHSAASGTMYSRCRRGRRRAT